GALCLGARLHLIDDAVTADPDAFASYMALGGVDVLKIVPSHLRALLHARQPERALPRTMLIVGGEASNEALVREIRRLRPGLRVVNHYGPTETTVGVATHELREFPSAGATVPIGRALAGAQLYVLDRHLNPVPRGVASELYIG